MAEARIDPEQLQQAVNYAVKRAIDRDGPVIDGPILIGIIAYPDDNRVDFREIQAAKLQAGS